MNRKILAWILLGLACASVAVTMIWRHTLPDQLPSITDRDFEEAGKWLNLKIPEYAAKSAPLALSRPVRLAIGGLGRADDEANRRLADLVLADLSGAPGYALVERQSLELALRELHLSLAGLVRAKDAVRAGRLVHADWFLLGTETQIHGTNSLVIRLVDARSGVFRDAAVFPCLDSVPEMAVQIAKFIRQSRQNAATTNPREYLALSAFADSGVNERLATFPAALRGYLTAAYRNSKITLLEREDVDALLDEVRLDLVGLTEGSESNLLASPQPAIWLVNGSYQSYETTNHQVEVILDVRRVFGNSRRFRLRGAPGEPVYHQVEQSLNEFMAQNAGSLSFNRTTEAKAQMLIGKETCKLDEQYRGLALVSIAHNWDLDTPAAAREKRNLEEAIRAFKTVLLLQPTNREARLYLAACMRNPRINQYDQAREYYREVIEAAPRDKWTGIAETALDWSFQYEDPETKHRWFEAASRQITNTLAGAYYCKQLEAIAGVTALPEAGLTNAIVLAESQLFETIRANQKQMEKTGMRLDEDFGMHAFASKAFGSDIFGAARHLAALLPRMQAEFPQLMPHLLAVVLTLQPDANTFVATNFEAALQECLEHPEQAFQLQNFWDNVRWPVYDWCCAKTNYALAVSLIAGERRAATDGYIYFLGPQFSNQEQVKLGYAYMKTGQWQRALEVFAAFSGRFVTMTHDGPWGRAMITVFPDRLVARCQQKLGQPVTPDPREFAFETNKVLPLHTPAAFTVAAGGLWVAIGGQLLSLSFDLQTNQTIALPTDADVPITCVTSDRQKIWIGTAGAGLIEYDLTRQQCRLYTETNGLLMNYISCLTLWDTRLWIGYGNQDSGGLGMLDLEAYRFRAFVPSMTAPAAAVLPPRNPVSNILIAPDALWLEVFFNQTFQLQFPQEAWKLPTGWQGQEITCMAADSRQLVQFCNQTQNNASIGQLASGASSLLLSHTSAREIPEELDVFRDLLPDNIPGRKRKAATIMSYPIRPEGVLHCYNFVLKRWTTFQNPEALPNPVTAMTLADDTLWVGGRGYVAQVDLQTGKMLRRACFQASKVDRIAVGGGYVWVQIGGYLYRAAMAAPH